jgi:hypothetical protein
MTPAEVAGTEKPRPWPVRTQGESSQVLVQVSPVPDEGGSSTGDESVQPGGK